MGKTYGVKDWHQKPNYQFKSGNPQGWGIPAMQKTHKRVITNVNNIFESPYVEDPAHIRAILSLDPKSGITVAPETGIIGIEPRTVVGGRFVARAFSNASTDDKVVNKIIVPFDRNRQWEGPLGTVLELGMSEKVHQLRDYIHSTEFMKSGITLHHSIKGANPSYPLLPGQYKHYTNKYGYEGIMGYGFIRGSWKEEKGQQAHFIYLTTLTVKPEEAAYIFWTEGERQEIEGRSEYVITFDIKETQPLEIEYSKDDPNVECWVRSDTLPLKSVDVAYSGRNDPAYYGNLNASAANN